MVEVAFLHYRPDTTFLHKRPGWIKLICLMAVSIIISGSDLKVLAAIFALLTAASFSAKPPLRKMRGALLFALIMTALLVYSEYGQTGFTTQLIVTGGRFVEIFWVGIIFTTVSDPTEIGDAFYILTRWVPFFPARRLRTLISLTLSFLPLIMDESLTLERAEKSRCFHRRKNPLLRLRYRVEPLLDGIFRKSEEISRAMAARCYGE